MAYQRKKYLSKDKARRDGARRAAFFVFDVWPADCATKQPTNTCRNTITNPKPFCHVVLRRPLFNKKTHVTPQKAPTCSPSRPPSRSSALVYCSGALPLARFVSVLSCCSTSHLRNACEKRKKTNLRKSVGVKSFNRFLALLLGIKTKKSSDWQ